MDTPHADSDQRQAESAPSEAPSVMSAQGNDDNTRELTPQALKAEADQILAKAGSEAGIDLHSDHSNAEAENETVLAQQNEILELKDKLLRALAEAENLRRRAAKEVADARNFAITKFARDILNVQDNLDRALSALGDNKVDEQNDLMKAMIEGVELTRNDLLSTLERNGIKPVLSDGNRFDPNHHQALFELESDAEPGTVIQTMQIGYTIGDRNLRPAMVGVAKARKAPEPDAGDQVDNKYQ